MLFDRATQRFDAGYVKEQLRRVHESLRMFPLERPTAEEMAKQMEAALSPRCPLCKQRL